MDGILGTDASATSDLTLLAYVFLLLPGMIIGFFFARRKMFVPYHKFTMTGITLVNWVLIAFVMLVSYSSYIAPYVPENFSDIRALIATIHLLSGGIAQGLATYLVILMWTERTRFEGLLPQALRIRRIKTPMRLTLALWITTVVLGLGIYFTWYVGGDEDPTALTAPGATEQADPATTPEASADLGDATPPASTEEVNNPASTDNAAPASTEGATNLVATDNAAPATTEDANANLAVNGTPPAVTEDVSANLAGTLIPPMMTDVLFPCPAVTEAVDDDDDDESDDDDDDNPPVVTESVDGLPPPAITESVFPCPVVTEAVDGTRLPPPAFTESVDDDDDDNRDRDDNSGSGSSNSGRDDDDDSDNSGSGSSNSGRDDNDDN